jgi:aspartyl-tRNA(Asn)/glutamyl-tRNA(Gln) amidotransferase subunit C
MRLSREEVEHVAALAHLALSPQEVEGLTEQLASVLDHVAKLQQVDTSSIQPTDQAVETVNVWREDAVGASLSVTSVLANAPRRHGDLFEVQGIFD